MTTQPGRSTPRGLEAIFTPRSIAVIGAGRDARSMSGRLYRNLRQSFHGPVYPVNPQTPEIEGERCWNSILDIPGPVDLAFVVVPARFALDVVRQCVAKSVPGLVMITAGFSEVGGAGTQLERELRETVGRAGVRMIGPNCFGVFNTDPQTGLLGTFADVVPPVGTIAVAAQSGALGVVIPEELRARGVGASMFASIGNKADVSENDLLEYWCGQPSAEVISLYLESFVDAAGFRRVASAISRQKPVVVLKAGRTSAGARAASSHTAALAGPDRAASALLRQAGVVRVDSLQELFDVSALLATQPVPAGRRVGILTNAGGPAILCADALAERGLELPLFSAGLQQALQRGLRPESSVRNPVDLIGSIDPGEYEFCLQHLLASREIDALITIYVSREFGTSGPIARVIHDASVQHAPGVTSLAVIMQTTSLPAELRSEQQTIPGFHHAEAAAAALARAVEYAQIRHRPAGEIPEVQGIDPLKCRAIVDGALTHSVADSRHEAAQGVWLSTEETLSLLAAAGVTLPPWHLAGTVDEAVQQAARRNVPVVLKAVVPGNIHKSDRGGVAINLHGSAAMRAAGERILRAFPESRGLLVQGFIDGGLEALVGLTREPQFGPVVTIGAGGTLVELLDDVACGVVPLTSADVDEMLSRVKLSRLMAGFRGGAPADAGAYRDLILRIAKLAELVPEILELDLNPVRVLVAGQGAVSVDARIRIRRVDAG